jgi:hypothetical protein
MTTTTQTLSEKITAAFRTEYAFAAEEAESDDERANALMSARAKASELIPVGTTGQFDDSDLSFLEDITE